jgi:hypothetical protein
LALGDFEAVLLELIANAVVWWLIAVWMVAMQLLWWFAAPPTTTLTATTDHFLDHEDGLIALCLGACQRPMTRMSAVMPSIPPVECALAGATRMVPGRLR